MSRKAFMDTEKNNEISADEAFIKGKNRLYYCYCRNCPAVVKVYQRAGQEHKYFRALPSRTHRYFCPMSSTFNFDENKYTSDGFVREDFFNYIMAGDRGHDANVIREENNRIEGARIPKAMKPRTVKQLYAMCKMDNVNEMFGDAPVGDLLIDERSFPLHHELEGYYLVELTYKNYGNLYDKKNMTIMLRLNSSIDEDFTLTFENDHIELFRDVRTTLYNRCHPDIGVRVRPNDIILVAGHITAENGLYHIPISSKRQIHIM